MTTSLAAPIAAIIAMLAMALVCGLRRIPLWNPIYLFVVAFSLQIALGWFLGRLLGMDFPTRFSTPLLSAYVLVVLVIFVGTMASMSRIERAKLRSSIFETTLISPGVYRFLVAVILVGLGSVSLSNALVTVRWGTLPVIAYNKYGQDLVANETDVVPGDVADQFLVPGLTATAVHLINPGVVAYFVLVFGMKLRRRRKDKVIGWGSVPLLMHIAFIGLLINAAILPQRHILMIALFTTVLLLVLSGRLKARYVVALGLLGIAGQIALGAARRGGERYAAADALGLPSVAGATIVYEPAVYLATGIPNFYIFWRRNDPHGYGSSLIRPLLPGPIARAIGIQSSGEDLLRHLSAEGYVLPGETLRTPWFEVYYEFGWPGVMAFAVIMSTVIMTLYRRALEIGERLSLTYFVALKPLLMFAIIAVVLDRTSFMQFAIGAIMTAAVRASTKRIERRSPLTKPISIVPNPA